jgi:hypothetical protein
MCQAPGFRFHKNDAPDLDLAPDTFSFAPYSLCFFMRRGDPNEIHYNNILLQKM